VVRQVLTTVVVLILLHPSSALCQTICPPQDYDSETPPNFDCPGPEETYMIPDLNPPRSVPVEEGTELVAEWEGALVHRNRLLEVGFTITGLRRLRWADRLRLAREYQIQLEHAEELARIRLEFMEEQRDVYQERARAAEQRADRARSWWRSPALWFTIGVLTAGALVALTAYGLSAVD